MSQEPTLADIYNELKTKVVIDKNNLDEELIAQPELFRRVAEAHVLASSLEHQAADNVKSVSAALNLEIRSTDEGKKATEATVSAKTLCDPRYKDAVELQLVTRKASGDLQSLKESFMQRSYVLKDLTQLFIAGYWSTNSSSGPRHALSEVEHKSNREALARKRGTLGPVPS